MIFDTHCHAYWKGLENRHPAIKARMDSERVMRSVQVGTDRDTNQKALSLAHKWGADTWCTAAMHPTSCQDLSVNAAPEWTARLKSFIRDNRDKIVAVGETGLDYYRLTKGRESVQKQTQRAFFIAHGILAAQLDLPLVIHTRDAASDTVALIKEYNMRRLVIHCFSEDRAFAEELLAWSDDAYFSFSGILTYKQALAVQDAACSLRLDRIMVETDAPFLVPRAVSGRFELNEPSCTRYVMDCLKELRSEPEEVVEQTVWENSNRFFRIE
ncbi:MAG: TatD family hydrolase [Acidobacteria bacterium]|nr:TatD family hydrolase [Acidobacteriota bacterium]